MTSGTGISGAGGSSPRPKRRSRFRLYLFLFLVVFGGGFYAGNAATKRVAVNGPDWVKKAFGVETGFAGTLAGTPPVGPSALPAATRPAGPLPAARGVPTDTPPDNPAAATPANPVTNPAPAAGTPTAPAGSDSLSTGDIDKDVVAYNTLLRRIQDAYRNYVAAQQILQEKNGSAEAMGRALDRQNAAAEDLAATVQKAQQLYTVLHGYVNFTTSYVETEVALPSAQLPINLPEMSLDNLKFVRKK